MGALIHSKLALIHLSRPNHAVPGGLPRSNPRLSDRMSRSEMAHRSPLPPTASQVMTSDIASGINESKNLDMLAAWLQQLWLDACMADAWWVSLSKLAWWRSRILSQWYQWRGSPSKQWWWLRTFWTLPAQASRCEVETCRWQSTVGKQRRRSKLGRHVRRQA